MPASIAFQCRHLSARPSSFVGFWWMSKLAHRRAWVALARDDRIHRPAAIAASDRSGRRGDVDLCVSRSTWWRDARPAIRSRLTDLVERGTSSMMSERDLPEAVAALITPQSEYAAVQANTDTVLADTQRRREAAMRRVAALGLSHCRIGELTGLSHIRVNQILGTGSKRPTHEVHFRRFGRFGGEVIAGAGSERRRSRDR